MEIHLPQSQYFLQVGNARQMNGPDLTHMRRIGTKTLDMAADAVKNYPYLAHYFIRRLEDRTHFGDHGAGHRGIDQWSFDEGLANRGRICHNTMN